MRSIFFFAAALLATAPASAQVGATIDKYMELKPEQRAIVNEAMSTYILHVYKADGDELTGVEIRRAGLTRRMLDIDTRCNDRALTDVIEGRVKTAPGVAYDKLHCWQQELRAQSLPYTAALTVVRAQQQRPEAEAPQDPTANRIY